MAPAKPLYKYALKRVKVVWVQKTRLDKNQRQQELDYKKYNVNHHDKKNWDKFNKVEVKLRK